MVQISRRIIPVLVDCAWGRKNTDLSSPECNRGYPTVLFTDPTGEVEERLMDRSPSAVARHIEDLARKYKGRDMAPSGPTDLAWMTKYDEAFKLASKEEKLLLVLLTDESEGAFATEHALASEELEDLVDRFVLHRHVIDRDCETCKKHRVTRGIHIHLLDPLAEDPYARPFQRFTGKKSRKSLETGLRRALDTWERKKEKGMQPGS